MRRSLRAWLDLGTGSYVSITERQREIRRETCWCRESGVASVPGGYDGGFYYLVALLGLGGPRRKYTVLSRRAGSLCLRMNAPIQHSARSRACTYGLPNIALYSLYAPSPLCPQYALYTP